MIRPFLGDGGGGRVPSLPELGPGVQAQFIRSLETDCERFRLGREDDHLPLLHLEASRGFWISLVMILVQISSTWVVLTCKINQSSPNLLPTFRGLISAKNPFSVFLRRVARCFVPSHRTDSVRRPAGSSRTNFTMSF